MRDLEQNKKREVPGVPKKCFFLNFLKVLLKTLINFVYPSTISNKKVISVWKKKHFLGTPGDIAKMTMQ